MSSPLMETMRKGNLEVATRPHVQYNCSASIPSHGQIESSYFSLLLYVVKGFQAIVSLMCGALVITLCFSFSEEGQRPGEIYLLERIQGYVTVW
jgi:hypothetical protein